MSKKWLYKVLFLFTLIINSSVYADYYLKATDDNTSEFTKSSAGAWYPHNNPNYSDDYITTFSWDNETQYATWQKSISSGEYKIYAFVPVLSSNYVVDTKGNKYKATRNAHYSIYSNGSNISNKTISQSGGGWKYISTYNLGSNFKIKLSDLATSYEKDNKHSIVFSTIKLVPTATSNGNPPVAKRDSPTGQSVTLAIGESQLFQFEATDVDGDIDYVQISSNGKTTDKDTCDTFCSSEGVQERYSWSSAGNYTVHGYVQDDRDNSDSVVWNVTVLPASNTAPVVTRDIPSSQNVILEVNQSQKFQAKGTDSDSNIDYVRIYSSGETTETNNCYANCYYLYADKTYSWSVAGNYIVTGKVRDDDGKTSYTTWNVTVSNPTPQIAKLQPYSITSSSNNIQTNQSVKFKATIKNRGNVTSGNIQIKWYKNGTSFSTDWIGTSQYFSKIDAGSSDDDWSSNTSFSTGGNKSIQFCIIQKGTTDQYYNTNENCKTITVSVTVPNVPNNPPTVSNVSGSINSNGDLTVSFRPYDPENSTMGALIYLSRQNDTENFNFDSRKEYTPKDFSGTSTRSISYTKEELNNLGITNGKQFKIRVNLYDDKSAEDVGKSSVITYNYQNGVDGVCGSANNKIYSYSRTSYGSDNQCLEGNSNNTAFPVAGDSVNWVCTGSNDGSNSSSCSASRDTEVEPPIDGAKLTNFYSQSIPKGEITRITLEGINLPSSLVANIQGTNGYCEQVSYSETIILIDCSPSTLGIKRFYIKDKPSADGGRLIAGSANWYITVTPPANTAPSIWVNKNYKKYTYVNSSYYVTAKNWDAEKNLKSIQVDWQADNEWNRLVNVSNPQGQDISFSYTPDSTGVLKFRFRAVDINGASSISKIYRVQIQPQPLVVEPSTGSQAIEKSKGKIATECEGNPITPANGAKIEMRLLLSVNGLVPINFDLQYNSLIRGKSSVGVGWDFANAYAAKVVEDTNGKVIVHWSENKAHIFNSNGDGSYTPESHACRLDTLQKLTTGLFKLERSGRNIYLFNEFNFLKRIENEKGQGLNFSYNLASQLVKVTESISGKYIEYSYNNDGYLVQATSNGGIVVRLEYLEDRLSKITHADGVVEEFTYTELDQIHTRSLNEIVLSTTTYDEFGRATEQDDTKSNNQKLSFVYTETVDQITTKVTDKNGEQKIMVFNKDYKLIQETDAIGNNKTFQYTDSGQPTSITDNNGNITTIAYNQYGDITSITTADGSTETRQYDNRRNLLKEINAYNKERNFTYDSANNLLTATDELGNTTRYSYNNNNQLISQSTPENRVTQYSYTNGLLTSVTNPKGDTRYLEYNQDGHLTAESDYRNNYTRYELDNLNRKISETDPLGSKQTWAYDARGNVLVYTDAQNNQTHYEYNTQNEHIKTTKSNSIWQYKYDGESRLIERIDPNGNSTHYERDALGRIIKTIDALGNTTEHQYDANNNLVREIDPYNQQSASSYDSMNRITQLSDALNNNTNYSYDALGRLHSTTDAASRSMQNSYDASSHLTSVLHPEGLTSKQNFDNDNLVSSVTTPSNDIRSLTRNDNANITDETTADAVSLQYQYNANNQLTNFTNGRNQVTTYSYITSRLVGKNDTVSDNTGYSYDANQNLTEVNENGITIDRKYDGFDRVIEYKEDRSQQSSIRYGFDKAGNLINLIYPHINDGTPNLGGSSVHSNDLGFTINYTYDALNRVISVKSGSLTLANYQYDQKGRITQLTRGNGSVLVYSYDAADRLISSIDKDTNGNIIVEQHYQYDDINRLTQETITPESSPPSELIQQVPMTFGADNRLLSKDGKRFDFDGDGNILEAEGLSLSFNARNQLMQAGNTGYQYNAEGNRISHIDSNQTKWNYIITPHHLGLPQTLRKYRDSDNGLVEDYIYGAQGLLAQNNHYTAGDKLPGYYYFHYDYRGSVIAVSDNQGQVVARYGYLPFGKQYSVSGNFITPFAYNGRDGVMADTNGLIYMRARYYSPDQHRFVSKDPLRGNISDLASLNRYAYVGGDPINAVDPSGKIVDIIADVGFIAYGLYRIGTDNIFGSCDNLNTNLTALGADIVALIIPGVTGLGAGIRATSHSVDAIKTFKNTDKKLSPLKKVANNTKNFVRKNKKAKKVAKAVFDIGVIGLSLIGGTDATFSEQEARKYNLDRSTKYLIQQERKIRRSKLKRATDLLIHNNWTTTSIKK